MLNVVTINGGRGAGTIIPALLTRQGLHVTSVVNAYDDGKSTGQIRKFFGMLGPSDIRKVQELMLPQDDPDYQSNLDLFRYRFPSDCQHDVVMSDLSAFGSSDKSHLMGIHLSNNKVQDALRSCVAEFALSLAAIERVLGEEFNFVDCSLMNCIYAGAFLSFRRNIEQATLFIDRLFRLRGTVLPTSVEDRLLVGLRENGQMLYSEAEIVELRSNVRIERIYLLDKVLDKSRFEALSTADRQYYLDRHHSYVPVSPSVELSLKQADIIIYAAGTQHSSLYPTYMSAGFAKAIADNKTAYKVFITNIGADYETPNYKASDYIRGAHRYLNLSDRGDYNESELFDVVLVNKSYMKRDETYVEYDKAGFSDMPVRTIVDAFESKLSPGKHDGPKLVQTILDLYESAALQKFH